MTARIRDLKTAAEVAVTFYCVFCSQQRAARQQRVIVRGGARRKICASCLDARKARERRIRESRGRAPR